MSELLPIIAEPRRREIMNLLRGGEQSVSALADHFSVSRPAISQHLKALLDAGLVDVRKDGRRRLYSLRPEGLSALRAELEQYWAAEFDDLIAASKKLRAESPPVESES